MPVKKRITLQDFYEEFVTRMGHVEVSQTRLVTEVAKINSRLTALEEVVLALRTRVEDLHGRLDNLYGFAENLQARFERLETEYVAITAALKRLEERLDPLEAERLIRRVAILEEKVARIEKSSQN